MATIAQIKKIHALKRGLFMTEEDYRAALSGFTTSEGKPIRSSKEMSKGQASSFIDALELRESRTPFGDPEVNEAMKEIRKRLEEEAPV